MSQGKRTDSIQENKGKYRLPRVRVWVHPSRQSGGTGDDHPVEWEIDTFRNQTQHAVSNAVGDMLSEAWKYIEDEEGTEATPVVAFDGFEFTPPAFWEYWNKEYEHDWRNEK